VRFWIGITDREWFDFLSARQPEEVNFWQPSPRRPAKLEPGVPFLFKLHAPDNFIVGGGFFVRFSVLPARLAWEAFGENNGTADYPLLRARVEQYRRQPIRGDPEIGCNILNAPFFFERSDWIPAPADWAPNIVQGRGYDSVDSAGAAVWRAVEARLKGTVEEGMREPRFGATYLTQSRLGQGAFRVLVTEAYVRRCAVTGERTLPVLEAAHIRPYSMDGTHIVSNGLLLRSDLHTLFDAGYLTVTEDLRVEVSGRIREQFENGKEYYKYAGQRLLVVPGNEDDKPAPDLLRWHNENVFVG